MKVLRIASCILACLSVAAAVPVGIFCGLLYVIIPLFFAVIFAFLMFFAKGRSEPAPPQETDFMNTDEQNAAILREQDKNNKDNM